MIKIRVNFLKGQAASTKPSWKTLFRARSPEFIKTASGAAGVSSSRFIRERNDLAAKYADVVFTAQQTLEGAKNFYRKLKNKAAVAGRNPDHIKIMPGVSVYVGRTQKKHMQNMKNCRS